MLNTYFLFILTIAFQLHVSHPEIWNAALMKQYATDEGNKSPERILTPDPFRGINLFPQVTSSSVTSKTENVQPHMTKKFIELWAKPEPAAGTGEKAPGADDVDSATEMTISIPRFAKDEKGNWVHHYYGVTYGKVWRDTRFNINGIYTVQRYRVDSKAIQEYYPRAEHETVCMGRSTLYNKPRVVKYLSKEFRSSALKHRPIWTTLRRQIYIHATSEECHNEKKFPTWQNFQDCQIRRNQRMEYMIPKYPLHQKTDI